MELLHLEHYIPGSKSFQVDFDNDPIPKLPVFYKGYIKDKVIKTTLDFLEPSLYSRSQETCCQLAISRPRHKDEGKVSLTSIYYIVF